jgi:hypothetical protein
MTIPRASLAITAAAVLFANRCFAFQAEAPASKSLTEEKVATLTSIFRRASPEIAADGFLRLLERGMIRNPKEFHVYLAEARSQIALAPRMVALYYSGGPAGNVAALRGSAASRDRDRLSLYSRAALVASGVDADETLALFRLASEIRSTFRSPGCADYAYPDYKHFHKTLSSLSRTWAKFSQQTKLSRAEFTAEQFASLNSFSEIIPMIQLIQDSRWTMDERILLLRAAVRGLGAITPDPRTYSALSRLIHPQFAELLNSLSELPYDLSALTRELRRAYANAVRDQLAYGVCGTVLPGSATKKLSSYPIQDQIRGLLQEFNSISAFSSVHIDERDPALRHAKIHDSKLPVNLSLVSPPDVSSCVSEFYRLYSNGASDRVEAEKVTRLAECQKKIAAWRAPDKFDESFLHFIVKQGSLHSLVWAAAGLGPTAPGRQNAARIGDFKPAASENSWSAWQAAIEAATAFLVSPVAAEVKSNQFLVWLGLTERHFEMFRFATEDQRKAVWASIERNPDPDMIALATIYGFHPHLPRLN